MNFRENRGLILIIIGILLSITLILIFVGIPLIILGTYYLNKKVNQRENEINEKLSDKKMELANIDNKLKEIEEEKEKELNEKLNDKKKELAYIDVKLEAMELQKEKEIGIKLKDKETQLANMDVKLEEKAKEKEKEINNKLKDKKTQLTNLNNALKEKKKELIFVEDELDMQDVGLYEPKYDFLTAVLFKEKLDEIRKKQKELVKNKTAAICGIEWTVDNSKQKGKAFTTANIQQILKNFNLECEIAISKVKHSNRENSIKRIKRVFVALNKLNEENHIKITQQYLDLKLQELDIAFEYDLKKARRKRNIERSKRT